MLEELEGLHILSIITYNLIVIFAWELGKWAGTKLP